MITKELVKSWIISNGHKPACPEIDVSDILVELSRGNKKIEFYVNPHNLCWFASTSWKNCNSEASLKYKFNSFDEFKSELRNVKLESIGI